MSDRDNIIGQRGTSRYRIWLGQTRDRGSPRPIPFPDRANHALWVWPAPPVRVPHQCRPIMVRIGMQGFIAAGAWHLAPLWCGGSLANRLPVCAGLPHQWDDQIQH